MCKYQKSKPQPESLPWPRVQYESECGIKLMLVAGHDFHGNPVYPKGQCVKCKSEIEIIASDQLQENNSSRSDFRYPMSYDQPCQIDCRVASCKFNKGAGKCDNVSPAITLNQHGKFVCWSQDEN